MQLLGFIRAPGFNRLPSPGEEVVLSFLPHASVASQTIDIFYTMSIAGTLCFVESRYVRYETNLLELQMTLHIQNASAVYQIPIFDAAGIGQKMKLYFMNQSYSR